MNERTAYEIVTSMLLKNEVILSAAIGPYATPLGGPHPAVPENKALPWHEMATHFKKFTECQKEGPIYSRPWTVWTSKRIILSVARDDGRTDIRYAPRNPPGDGEPIRVTF